MSALGRGGWPLVPSPHYPQEKVIACPKCGSTDVSFSCVYGRGGRLGDPGASETNRCQSCGWFHIWAAKT